MTSQKIVLAAFGLTLALSVSLGAQESLGDIARAFRQERARQGKKATKVYTNDNLPARPPGEGLTASAGMSNPAAVQPSVPPPSAARTPTAPAGISRPPEQSVGDKSKTKDYWQGQFKSARAALASAKEEQQLAEDELQLLRVQQARELNPDVQSEVAQKISAKSAELEAKRAATAKAQAALDKLEKEFKESGAPEDLSKTD